MKSETVLIKKFHNKLPKFKDGRINYASSNIAPVVTLVVKHKEEYLLMKRSQKVNTYKGKWGNVGGYIDQLRPAKEIALQELREEIGITEEQISSIKRGNPSEYFDRKINMTWIVFPFLIELEERPEIKLDWEHEEFRWIKPEEIKNFDIVPDIDKYFNYLFY